MSEEIIDVANDGGVPAAPAATDAPMTPAAPAPASLDLASRINPDGTFKENFLAGLPEDLGKHGSLAKYKSITDLAKGYVNSQALIGKKASDFWKSDDPKVIAERKAIMGIPDSVDGYDLVMPEIPDGVKDVYTDATINDFKTKASEIGLTKDQAKALLEWDAGRATKAFEGVGEQMEVQKQQAAETLKAEWGRKFDENLAKVKKTTDYLGITEVLDSTGLGNEPLILKSILEKIVPAISEDRLIGDGLTQSLATIHDQVRAVDDQLLSFKGNPSSPEYRALVRQKEKLYSQLS